MERISTIVANELSDMNGLFFKSVRFIQDLKTFWTLRSMANKMNDITKRVENMEGEIKKIQKPSSAQAISIH